MTCSSCAPADLSGPFYLFASYGNDSMAMIQWAHERGLCDVTVAYSDTGWAAPWWKDRIQLGEALAHRYGFRTVRIQSEGMEQLVRRRKGWPWNGNGGGFCTFELKILPAQRFMSEDDPDVEAICMTAIRRAESAKRATAPEWRPYSDRHGDRPLWSPIVDYSDDERDALLSRAGVESTDGRSRECWPCFKTSSRKMIAALPEWRISEIESIENEMGLTRNGRRRNAFRAHRHMGAQGIREVVEWARSERGKFCPGLISLPGVFECDSGMCGI